MRNSRSGRYKSEIISPAPQIKISQSAKWEKEREKSPLQALNGSAYNLSETNKSLSGRGEKWRSKMGFLLPAAQFGIFWNVPQHFGLFSFHGISFGEINLMVIPNLSGMRGKSPHHIGSDMSFNEWDSIPAMNLIWLGGNQKWNSRENIRV